MPLPKQIKTVRLAWYSASGTTEFSAYEFSIQNMDIKIMHENPLGNPTYSKSLNGFLVPYGVKSRIKFDVQFDRMRGADISDIRNIFNNFITYHNSSDVTTRFYYKYTNQSGTVASGSTDRYNVLLETPMEMAQRYQQQIGTFAPSISLITQDLVTSVPSDIEGI